MEADESKKSLPAPAVNLMIWCVPTLVLLLIGVFGIGLIPNQASLPSFVIILVIGLIVTRLIFLLRSRRKAWGKAGLIGLWLIILGTVVFVGLFMPKMLHRWTKTNAQNRFETKASELYPEVFTAPLEVGAASSVEYHEFIACGLIFESRSCILLCNYDESGYKEAIVSLDDRYRFRTDSLKTGCFDDDHVEITIDPYAIIRGDRFQVLFPEDGSYLPFYKECLMIMNNDDKHQIAYIVFSDFDLDMADDLAAFINEYCGWKYIQGT